MTVSLPVWALFAGVTLVIWALPTFVWRPRGPQSMTDFGPAIEALVVFGGLIVATLMIWLVYFVGFGFWGWR